MMKKIVLLIMLICSFAAEGVAQEATGATKTGKPMSQLAKPYDESLDATVQIKEAVAKAGAEGKNVICQVGGNWCKWCLWFADYITTEQDIAKIVSENFVYIHVNYSPKNKNEKAMEFFGNPKLGYPFFVVLNSKDEILKVQESACLEEGQGYDKEKVLAFFNSWLPEK